MNTLPSVAVLANCTHISIARALRKSGLFSEVGSFELYTIPVEDRESVADSLVRYDLILTLEHADGFGALATRALRSRFGDRITALPTPFFSGLMPDMAYITLRGEISRAPGILGDYHSALILAECVDGLPDKEIVRRYQEGTSFERMNIEGVWEDSIQELKRRENSCEIRISDYIIMRRNEGMLSSDFLSFNHPTEGLINHVVKSFIDRIFGSGKSFPPLTSAEHNLYQDARWPLHPAVAARLGLQPSADPMFKGPNRLGGEVMSISEFARRSCEFFLSTDSPADFQVMTPGYLSRHIRSSGALRLDSVITPSRPLPSKVNLCIIGAAKAGTTSLFDALACASEIEGSNVKEVRYFNANYDKGTTWYHNHFSFGGQRLVMEATPEYANPVLCHMVPERMAEYNPGMKLIFCVRDPFLRLRSQINHFRKALPQFYPDDRGCIVSKEGYNNFVARSLYNRAASGFLKFFPESQLHVFDLDDPDNMEKLSEFLGIALGGLPRSNVQSENPLSIDKVIGWLKEADCYELIRSDVSLFRKRFGIGANWRIMNEG